ncbi:MAG: hypothetical protein KY455_13250 [Euryarchaeota archaeon]|nr:hypothetical protein [Euryarchaeota archaeon]
MATALEANLALFAGLVSLGFGIILAAIGFLTARRIGTGKLVWVSIGFLLLAAQGGHFAWRVHRDPVTSPDAVLVPALLGLLSLVALYIAVYRRP